MNKLTKIITKSALGVGLIIGGVSLAVSHNVKEADALYNPSTTYSVSDTAEELASYYSSVGDGDTGTTLLGKLQSINSSKRKKTMGYGTMGTSINDSAYIYTDFALDSTATDSNGQVYGTKVASFYTKTSATGWNREHVWPNSKGGGTVDGDILMTRPTISSENSSRGNSYYVEGMNSSSAGWDPYTAGYAKEMRGEAARIILYCVVANSNLKLSDASSSSASNTMGDMDTLIKWHFDYSPSTYEMNRNNGAEYLQGNRNPFVDHPEYVAKIWSNFNSNISSICSSRASMYDEWVPGTCSTYGTNDAAGEPSSGGESGGGESGGGESGGGEQGGGSVGEVVTANSQVANGDKVYIRTQESTPKGVTGWNNNKDATVSTTQANWVQYTVGSASSSGFTLKDESASLYIASPSSSSNEFKYDSTGGVCSVNSEGYLICNEKYLCVNGSNYRFYKSVSSYTPFYVYLASSSGGSGGDDPTPQPTVYTITYNANGGSGSMDPTSGEAPQVQSCTFAREGYTFSRWNSQANGGGTDYAVGTTVSADVTLYAIWEENASPTPASGSYKYYKLSSVDEVTSGTYVIAAKVNSTYYAMSNTFSSKISGSTITVNNDNEISVDASSFKVDIEKVNDKYTIKSGSSYLTYSSGTNLGTSLTAYNWTFTSGVKGTFRGVSSTSGRSLIFRTTSDKDYYCFGGYSNSNISASGNEFYDIELFKAFTSNDFANHILSNINCVNAGTSEPTYADGYSWSVLSGEFTNKLTSSEQSILIGADASESGSVVERAVAKYDYIISKYGVSKYPNFMNRSLSNERTLPNNSLFDESNNMVMIVMIISLVSLTSILTLLVIKKARRH